MKEPGKIRRSFQLLKSSWGVLRAHKQLIWFPVLSTLASLVILALVAGPVLFGAYWSGGTDKIFKSLEGSGLGGVVTWGLLFLAYWASFTIANFFNTGLIAEASKALKGEEVSWKDGVRFAWSKIGVIVQWSALAATVGVLFNMIEQWLEDRLPVVGSTLARIPVAILGAAWTMASVLVVPILVHENVGPVEALKRSAGFLRKTWGENIVGRLALSSATSLLLFLGLGLWVTAAALSDFYGSGVLAKAILFGGLPFAVCYAVGLIYVSSALNGIFQAALYGYAAKGVVPPGYDREAFEKYYRVKPTEFPNPPFPTGGGGLI